MMKATAVREVHLKIELTDSPDRGVVQEWVISSWKKLDYS
jgi:hypothetical protein